MLGRTAEDWKARRKVTKSGRTLAFLAVAVIFAGCVRKTTPEGYRVVSYDNNTKQWTIIRNGTFEGEYRIKRLTVVCDFYKWGNHEPVSGPDACDLQIGRLIVPNHFSKDRTKFLDVYEMSTSRLSITEGDGDDRVSQQFVVVKYELLPPK